MTISLNSENSFGGLLRFSVLNYKVHSTKVRAIYFFLIFFFFTFFLITSPLQIMLQIVDFTCKVGEYRELTEKYAGSIFFIIELDIGWIEWIVDICISHYYICAHTKMCSAYLHIEPLIISTQKWTEQSRTLQDRQGQGRLQCCSWDCKIKEQTKDRNNAVK